MATNVEAAKRRQLYSYNIINPNYTTIKEEIPPFVTTSKQNHLHVQPSHNIQRSHRKDTHTSQQ
jgi:hypothetical protein